LQHLAIHRYRLERVKSAGVTRKAVDCRPRTGGVAAAIELTLTIMSENMRFGLIVRYSRVSEWIAEKATQPEIERS
jgi:hypothetical protein